jgi:DNA polymerase III subunit epsilon
MNTKNNFCLSINYFRYSCTTKISKISTVFTVIDIETTGNSYKNGKITEIAIVSFNGNEITDVFQTLLNPEMDIPYPITRLTGIDNDMVKNAPKFFMVARKIVELTAGKIFVAHNVNFDYKFIQEEFGRLGYDFQRKKLCTVQLSRKLLPGYTSYSLGNICSVLNISNETRHRAAGDALATVKLLDILLKTYQEKGLKARTGKTLKLF